MKLTKEQLMEQVKARIGDTPSDDDIKFLEDITDTLAEFGQPNNDAETWKQKYEENDKQWREKYTKRFFEPTLSDQSPVPLPEPSKTDEEKRAESIDIGDLFTSKE